MSHQINVFLQSEDNCVLFTKLIFFQDEVEESRLRVSSLVEQIQIAHDKRSALYQSYNDAINKYKASKDAASFANQKKRVDSDYKALTHQINSLMHKIKSEAAGVAEKVSTYFCQTFYTILNGLEKSYNNTILTSYLI